MVTRYEDWPKRLSAYLKERKAMPFAWAENDCMAFVAKGVEALTGHDFFSLYNDYTDEATATVLLENNGGIHGIITACLGEGSKKIMNAKRGDVVLVKVPAYVSGMVEDSLAGGIVDDTGLRVAMVSKDGLLRVPLHKAVRLWGY